MMEPPRSLRRHQMSPSFADSAIDIESTSSTASDPNITHEISSPKSKFHSVALSERLLSLARRIAIAEQPPSTFPSSHIVLDEQGATTIHEFIDNIESLLGPRPKSTKEINRSRPRPLSPLSRTAITETNELARHSQSFSQELEGTSYPIQQTRIPYPCYMNDQLEVLLEGISKLTTELSQRHVEARHIHRLYTFKCERLAQRVIELEAEVHELQSDILEDSIEIEGIRGTVQGLESWIGRWECQRAVRVGERPGHSSSSRQKKKSTWGRKSESKEGEDENDCDALLEGINAWMRGWRDVEEGFRIRARRRKLRREGQEATREDYTLPVPSEYL